MACISMKMYGAPQEDFEAKARGDYNWDSDKVLVIVEDPQSGYNTGYIELSRDEWYDLRVSIDRQIRRYE